MKRSQFLKRFLSLIMVAAMLVAYAVPAGAAAPSVLVEKVENDSVSASLLTERENPETDEQPYADEDMVRVSIMLKEESAVEAGFAVRNVGTDPAVAAYRSELESSQQQITRKIEKATSSSLDVVWNLTLAANLISANVAYGDIKTIEEIPGVEKVVLETRYYPQEATTDATAHPNMAVSSQMVGSNIAWQSGLTGAGRRIAVIDTGLDMDHQSVDPKALEAAYRENAEAAGLSYEEYVASLDLLDEAEIESVLSQLNVTSRYEGATAEMIYQNLKVPFGYNYIDNSFYLTHDEDQATEHGSHVAGISAANRLVEKDGAYVNAADTVGVVGDAPDAQIIVMKVFGKGGGAYDSDYMAAIEDAIVLGCDSANLSLGSSAAGMVRSEDYQEILDGLTQTNTVVSISAGNNSYWSEKANHVGLPYVDAPNYHTGGSPGTYENSLCVASVDNDGRVGSVFTVADESYLYSESDYSNEKLATLDTTEDGSGVTLDYVMIDGIGAREDYEGIDLTGKVVFCNRGGISFFEKGNIAAELGAAASVICNNQPGVINMDLTDYTHTQPCISITLADAQQIKAASTAVTENGKSYYTGKMTVSAKLAVVHKDSEYLTMSAFSSWGVPGDLTMKPEITAPGGEIYSINGAVSATDQYELMSGTSMAAPQIAGISALVLQYIQENNLSQPGMTDRALAQSLMMSTATPLVDGNSECYYPVIQQGAGLVNTAAATSADSFVTVAGVPDGKVKAELGDDPQRDGVYTVRFTLHNMTDEAKAYALSADLFTQNLVAYYPNADAAEADDQSRLAMFFDKTTMPLDNSLTTWTVNGAAPAGDPALDLNGDGVSNKLDAQMILDYTTGLVKDIPAAADINADGAVTTYDAHLLLNALDAGNFAVVPASGTAEVEVTLTLTEADKNALDEYCTAGAYVQAYICADAIADEEGSVGTSHSIPVLGFYGNWADASMFDIGSYVEYASGEEVRTPYLLDPNANAFGVAYADAPQSVYYFGGNPLLPDVRYMPERDAMNANDILANVSFTAIRNAGASRLVITNTDSGKVLSEQEMGPVMGAFFDPHSQGWSAGTYSLDLGFVPSEVKEGDHFKVDLELASEYYVDDNGSVDWDALTDGSRFSMSAVIDNTAPEVGEVKLNEAGDKLLVNASDNQYVAAVILTNAAGTQILGTAPALEDAEVGQSAQYALDLAGVSGKNFLLQVADYAMNLTTYRVDIQIGDIEPMPEMLAFHFNENVWYVPQMDAAFDPAVDAPHCTTRNTYTAATIVDHIILAVSADGTLYVMPEYDMTFETPVANLGCMILDMAYNAADDLVYALDENNILHTVDRFTGALTEVGEVGILTNTLACDKDGTFYSTAYGSSEVYRYTLDTLSAPELVATVEIDGAPFVSEYLQSMEADPDTGMVYWMSYLTDQSNEYCRLIALNPADGTYTVGADQQSQVGCLLLPAQGEGGEWGKEVDEATGVQMNTAAASVLRGGTVQLSALVQPWNSSDRSVSWSSDDESVATVDGSGLVTGVGVGTATITATSTLNPNVSAACEVTVNALDVTLGGMLQNADGEPVFFDWNMAQSDSWTAGAALGSTFISGTHDTTDDCYFVLDDSDNNAVHKISANGENLDVQPNGAGVPLWDMAYSPVQSKAGAPMVSSIYGYFLLAPMDPMNLQTQAFNLQGMVQYLIALTSLGAEEIPVDGQMVSTEHLVMLDSSANVLDFWIYPEGDSMSAMYEIHPSNLKHKFTQYQDKYTFTNMVVGTDGNLYLSAFDGTTNVLYRLAYNADTESYDAVCIGDFGKDIWPAVLTEVTANGDTAAAAVPGENAKKMEAVTLTAEELAAFRMPAEDHRASVGGLNTVTAAAPTAAPAAVSPLGTVTVEIKAEDVTTNGLYTFELDPEVVTLNRVSSDMDLVSYRQQDGTVTLAFANKLEVPADTVVAELVLSCRGYHVDTVLKPVKVEHNDQTPNEAMEEIEIHIDNCPGARFDDFESEKWYHEAVDYVVFNDLMNGKSDSYFGLYENITRAQLVTILHRADGALAAGRSSGFPDVPADAYYADAVAWAVENDIVKGNEDGSFSPDRNISRAEMITIFYRYAQYHGEDVSARADMSRFTDCCKDMPEYAANAMSWAVATGLVRGTSETTLSPRDTATRAQAASVIFDYMTRVAK